MKYLMATGFAFCVFLQTAKADISDTYRKQNAVVLYEFAETTGDIIDTADPKFGPALNLSIYSAANTYRNPGALTIGGNLITSKVPAAKIISQCKASGSLSVELWIEGNGKSEIQSGLDTEKNPQPLRLLSLSSGFKKDNFLVGQFYDAGDLYIAGVSTSMNQQSSTLKDPLKSTVDSTLVVNPQRNPSGKSFQKIVMTLGPTGLARLYLSDSDSYMYLASSNSTGFGTAAVADYFKNWDASAYLSLGNEYMPLSTYTTVAGQSTNFGTDCKSSSCLSNPNRPWSGTLHKVAVYCTELSKDTILGTTALSLKTNPLFDIDLGLQITPAKLKAQDIYVRLTGVKTPITNPLIAQMETLINNNDMIGAATKATDEASFLNITVRDFAAKMSNRDETIAVPLNDFTATVVGFVRDDLNAQKLLTENIVYQADRAKAPIAGNLVSDMLLSNNHYETLSTGRYNLKEVLVATTQKIYNGTVAVDNPEPAGLLTTRQWMAAHAIAGTNRRLVEYTFREFTCHALDTVADAGGPDNVIGPDIDRFPGGSHSKFTTTCRACHTIMDGFRPAFSHWTFSNNFAKNSFIVPKIAATDDEDKSTGMIQSPDYISYKVNKNATVFPEGRITIDDNWVNNANRGANADTFKWTKLAGKGLKELGQAIVETPAFASCMAERVFQQVCKRPSIASDRAMLDQVTKEFSTTKSYNLKFLFQRIVTTPECLGSQ